MTGDINVKSVDDIRKLVCTIIADMLCIAVPDVTLETTLIELGADSFHMVELAARLDTQFGIKLPRMYSMAGKYTVGKLVSAVVTQLEARA